MSVEAQLARYLRSQEEGDRFHDWCEDNDFDPDTTEALAAFEQYVQWCYEPDPDAYDEPEPDWGEW